jgi:hypothetical protein
MVARHTVPGNTRTVHAGVLKRRRNQIRRPFRDEFIILRLKPGTLSLATFPRRFATISTARDDKEVNRE